MTTKSQQHINRFLHWRKLPAKLTPIVFAFYMSAIMAVLMCLIITAVNQGLGDGYLLAAIHAYQVAMPSAFVCVMLVRPIVMRLVAGTVVAS
jgi:predicted Co/Zn/Cd cation transporter (cation efflux family)